MVIISSCYYDNEEELYPSVSCETTGMSLQTDIEPILERNCYRCHSVVNSPANGNIILEGHNELIKYVNSGELLGAIKRESGFSPMPKDASKLSNCDIAKIENWVLEGALDN
jgi:hypothetical protein